MVVYVESNFVLELALGQAQAAAAEAILALAEGGAIELAIPAISLSECHSRMGYRRVDVLRFIESLNVRQRELELALPTRNDVAAALTLMLDALADTLQKETTSLQAIMDRVTRRSRILTTDAVMLAHAASYRSTYRLEPVDSMIYATIVADLGRGVPMADSCFISRDAAFAQAGISAELASLGGSRYISNFPDGLRFIQSTINRKPSDP